MREDDISQPPDQQPRMPLIDDQQDDLDCLEQELKAEVLCLQSEDEIPRERRGTTMYELRAVLVQQARRGRGRRTIHVRSEARTYE